MRVKMAAVLLCVGGGTLVCWWQSVRGGGGVIPVAQRCVSIGTK